MALPSELSHPVSSLPSRTLPMNRNLPLLALLTSLVTFPACGGDSSSSQPEPPPTPDSGTDAPPDASPEASPNDADAQSPPAWSEPACSAVKGTWAVTFTKDDGATVAPGEGTLGGVAYTYGLAALDTPNVLLAEHSGRILRSEDAGCTWTDLGAAPGVTTVLRPAKGGLAYGFSPNGSVLYRIDGTTILTLSAPTPSIMGVQADPSDGTHVRAGGNDGQLYDSPDRGNTFSAIGTPAPAGCAYVVAFDPSNLAHVLCGTAESGTFVTTNSGATWTASEGDAQYTNTFSAAVSPADGNVVWIEGIQLGWHNGQQIGPEGRRIWRSTDGGLNFTVVLEEGTTTATLFNGNLLAPHPVDTNLLYFTFGTPPLGGNGSESFLYRLDASTSEVVEHRQAGIDSYDALVFSPANPSLIYLGKSAERPNTP